MKLFWPLIRSRISDGLSCGADFCALQLRPKSAKMKNIYLVGFMGTGKTAIGKELAEREKRQFADLDELIAEREKRSIPEIFAQSGEPYFRDLEKNILEELSRKTSCVVSCGGGIVINPDNIRRMKETGIIICLTASVDVILARTSKFTNRPLLNVADPKEKIAALLKERAPFYCQADMTIDTSKISVKESADKISDYLKKK